MQPPPTDFEVLDAGAHRMHGASTLVPQYHRRAHDEVTDATIHPVVHVAAADADSAHFQQHLCR